MVFCKGLWQYCVFTQKKFREVSLRISINIEIFEFADFAVDFCSFFCACFDNFNIIQRILEFYKIFLRSLQFWLLPQNSALVLIARPTIPLLYILEYKTKSNIQLCCTIELLNIMSCFWLKVCESNISMPKLKTLCLPYFILESKRNCLHVSDSFLNLSVSVCLTSCVT